MTTKGNIMASAKSRRYGQGGHNHKQIRQDGRPNGKAFKSHPKGFDRMKGRLVPVLSGDKGKSFPPSLREVRELLARRA